MTRQRLREGSIKWETQLSLGSFAQKILKKIQYLAFSDKVKIIKSYVPEKVKLFIEKNLIDELKYFQKKYCIKIEILSDAKLIIPEYKIELINKSKKIINTIENINKVLETKKFKKDENKVKKTKKKEVKKIKKEIKKRNKKETKNTLGKKKKKLNQPFNWRARRTAK